MTLKTVLCMGHRLILLKAVQKTHLNPTIDLFDRFDVIDVFLINFLKRTCVRLFIHYISQPGQVKGYL